jgi:hypothetical protein
VKLKRDKKGMHCTEGVENLAARLVLRPLVLRFQPEPSLAREPSPQEGLIGKMQCIVWRREWDSNPRSLSTRHLSKMVR